MKYVHNQQRGQISIKSYGHTELHRKIYQRTEVRFASFLPGGFITDIVVNPPESKLAKRTSVQWCDTSSNILPALF